MIRLWFRARARNFLCARPLQTKSRPARRPRAFLRLEQLEDREVTSTLPIAAPGLLAPPVAVISYERMATQAGEPAPADNGGVNATGLGGPGLDKLLQDVQNFATPAADLPTSSAPSADLSPRFIYQVATPDAVAGDDNIPSSPNSPGPGETPQRLAPAGGTFSFDVIRAENVVALPGGPEGAARTDETSARLGSVPNIVVNPVGVVVPPGAPEGVARTDGAIAQTGSVSIVVNPAGAVQRPTSQAGPAASPEVHDALTGPAAISPLAASGQVVAYQADSSLTAYVTATRPPQGSSDRAGPEPSGVGPPSRQVGAADLLAAPTEVQRLPADLSDGALLQRFVADGEQAAFTALVQRYERLVLGVCQRVLGDVHAAQDAFQATFLVLARKASILDKENPLAGWLYKVAYHLALRLRAVAARQRQHEQDATTGGSSPGTSDGAAELDKQELSQALHEELQRLPAKYRVPLVLCYFDGLTHDEAARAMGLPRGSMAKRIGEGLERLRERLRDRGFLP